MNYMYIARLVVATSVLVAAITLSVFDTTGWGWFVIVALLIWPRSPWDN